MADRLLLMCYGVSNVNQPAGAVRALPAPVAEDHIMKLRIVALALALGYAVLGQPATDATVHARAGDRYEVHITNVTPGQSFTPLLAVTHSAAASVFDAGTLASPELRMLAEGGDVAPLTSLLLGMPASVMEVVSSAGLTTPGVTTTLIIMGGGTYDRLSVAAMLIPTNDAFVGVNTALPLHGEKVLFAYAWDAGTEGN